MALCLKSSFLPPLPMWAPKTIDRNYDNEKSLKKLSISITCSSVKRVRSPKLDKHVVKQNKIRFVQKLKTLLLSKPKRYIPLNILSKCRSYLALPKPRSLRSMIYRYPTIFEVFTIPTPPTALYATKWFSQQCVGLTPAAAALAVEESKLKSAMSISLATKLQKLLMLSTHHRLLLSKLVHLAPDLGLPPNFRSRLCNDHPEKFKIVDTSYGRALELVSWDSTLANPLPSHDAQLDLIVDRPLKFKHLRLRKGLNVKRRHQEFLIKFGELQGVCPYKTPLGELAKESIEAEKRACGVVREVLGMMVEKRTLVDHLTHFRKDFGLSNRLHAMLLRHPELFYLSFKGQRDSVFLVEAYDDDGRLLEKDESLKIKNQLMELIREGKRMRREWRKGNIKKNNAHNDVHDEDDPYNDTDIDNLDDEYVHGFEDLLDSEDVFEDDAESGDEDHELKDAFWIADASSADDGEARSPVESW